MASSPGLSQDSSLAAAQRECRGDAQAPIAQGIEHRRPEFPPTTLRATRRPGARCAPSMTAARCSSSFQAASAQGQMPPCVRHRPDGGELVNYAGGSHMIVDRCCAELRMATKAPSSRVDRGTDGRPR